MDLNRTPAQMSDAVAEEVRALAHRTQSSGEDWQYPGDAYSVAGSLATAAMRLPQVLNQVQVLVERLAAEGRLRSDRGTLESDLAETLGGLGEARAAANRLYEALDRVHQGLGPVAYKE